jgi:hypothetical protein
MTSLSRTGQTNPLGKFTAEFPKFKGPEETHELATRLAREQDMTLAEWVRELVMIRVHGIDMMTTLHADRLRGVAGMGEESSPARRT